MPVNDQIRGWKAYFLPKVLVIFVYLMNWKQLTVFSMFFLMLAQAGLKTGVVAYYYLNQDYIAKNWCEQRNQPRSCCAGSCQVNKWLKVADLGSQEQGAPVPDWSKFQDLQLFVESWEPVFLGFFNMPVKSSFPACYPRFPTGSAPAIFHPPC